MLTLGITASSLISKLTRVFTSSQNFTLPSGYSKMSVYILADGASASGNYVYADPGDSNGDGNYENSGEVEQYSGAGGGLRYSLDKPYTPGQSMNISKNGGYYALNEVIVNGTSYLSMRNAIGSSGQSQGAGNGGDGVFYGGNGGSRTHYYDPKVVGGGGAAGTTSAGGNGGYTGGASVYGARGSGISFTDDVSGITYTNGSGGTAYGGGGNQRGAYDANDAGQSGFIAVVFS